MRSGQKKDRDGDCGDHNQQRIDAALHGGSVRVNFWGHGGLRGVFWGSGEGFEENLINWQDNFLKFFTKSVITLEWPAYEEKNRSPRDLGRYEFSILRQKITEKAEMRARASYQFSVIC